ncbi:MAG TPA: NUDIX hydrolase, partial [Bacteroidetes bacterium]|nr:NUDIX hydrolase [Bacteroidota bacterium]
MPYSYKHARPSLTVDCVVFSWDGIALEVLLIERGETPFVGAWALPGGFVQMDEDLETAALRELQEETGLTDMYLEQLYTFGKVGRDPRGRVVTVAYFALINKEKYAPARGASDARLARWFLLEQMPELAFDHQQILAQARKRLQDKVRYAPIGFELLPPKFSLSQLQQLYETILGTELDKRNFRKKLMGMDVLVELDEYEQGVAHRAAKLFRFDPEKYRALES